MLRWLQQLSLRRAAKSYARILPQRLLAGWGASEFYTPGQVRAALGATGLGGRYVAIAFAAFLTREEFDALVPSHPHPIAYDNARELFERFRGGRVWDGYKQEPISNNDAVGRHGIGG